MNQNIGETNLNTQKIKSAVFEILSRDQNTVRIDDILQELKDRLIIKEITQEVRLIVSHCLDSYFW